MRATTLHTGSAALLIALLLAAPAAAKKRVPAAPDANAPAAAAAPTEAGTGPAGDVSPAPEGVVDVLVQRDRTPRIKHPSMRFLRDNRDFVRACLDRTRMKLLQREGGGVAMDPRYLEYPKLLASILAAKDSVAVADDAARRRVLLESVTQLGQLESQLDQLERLLAEQRDRLGVLQKDFTGEQHTALMVVVSGWSGGTPVDRVAIRLEDGDTVSVALSLEQQQSLQHGGVVQVFHGFVEPRAQDVQVAIAGQPWPGGDAGFVRLDPPRDRITLLRLDLAGMRPDLGATSIQATTWQHDTRPAASGS